MNPKIIGTALGVVGVLLWFMPLVSIQFMGLNVYQAGHHIGGIAYLLLLASLAYAILSWMELHVPRIIAASVATAICLLFFVQAGMSTDWGLMCLTCVSIASIVLAVRDNKSPKKKFVEYYHIFDIKTAVDRYTVAEAASKGLGNNVSSADETRPIPNFSEPPEKPGRFQITSSLAGTKFEKLASMGGGNSLAFKTVTCDGAVWTARAVKSVEGSSNLVLSVCLWQYQQGYHLDTYAIFQKTEGERTEGYLAQISRLMAPAMGGAPEEWTEKTFLDIVRSIQKATDAEITILEGYPQISELPGLIPTMECKLV